MDSSDDARLNEARDELHRVLSDDLLRDASVLVLANKQDLPHVIPTSRIADCLGLRGLAHRNAWYIQGCSAVSGDGIFEGLDWLHTTLREKRYAARAG